MEPPPREVFQHTGTACPNMDWEDLLAHIELMDPTAHFRMTRSLDEDQRQSKHAIINSLMEFEPVLYDYIENILITYQDHYHAASRARQQYIRHYHQYVVFRNTAEQFGFNPLNELQEELMFQEPAQPAKKRNKEQVPEELKEQQLQIVEEVAQSLVGTEPNEIKKLYFRREPYTEDFELHKYRHFVKKGRKKWDLHKVDHSNWNWVYHCTGPWQAEELKVQLKRLSPTRKALIIKQIRGAEEILSYKVISNE